MESHRVNSIISGRSPPLHCVCVFSSHPFWTSSSLDVPAGVTQEEGHTGFLIHLPSAVYTYINHHVGTSKQKKTSYYTVLLD